MTDLLLSVARARARRESPRIAKDPTNPRDLFPHGKGAVSAEDRAGRCRAAASPRRQGRRIDFDTASYLLYIYIFIYLYNINIGGGQGNKMDVLESTYFLAPGPARGTGRNLGVSTEL